MTGQLRQSLAAPPWDPEDWEWRPTVIPDIARLPHMAEAEGNSGAIGSSQKHHIATACGSTSGAEPTIVAMLASFLNTQAELEGPRGAVAAIQDQGRYKVYRHAIAAVLKDKPGEG